MLRKWRYIVGREGKLSSLNLVQICLILVVLAIDYVSKINQYIAKNIPTGLFIFI